MYFFFVSTLNSRIHYEDLCAMLNIKAGHHSKRIETDVEEMNNQGHFLHSGNNLQIRILITNTEKNISKLFIHCEKSYVPFTIFFTLSVACIDY